jgi:two-component system, chemotaxis family, chemotaxis protein CheY
MARILVIDDHASIRVFLRDALTAAGHDVFVADDGRSALSLYRQFNPDLVITDIFMPEQDGLGLILALMPDDAKIIAISGGGDFWKGCHLDDAVAFGARRMLRKPFTAATLCMTVDDILASPSETRIPPG